MFKSSYYLINKYLSSLTNDETIDWSNRRLSAIFPVISLSAGPPTIILFNHIVSNVEQSLIFDMDWTNARAVGSFGFLSSKE